MNHMKRNRSLLIALTVFGALTCTVLQCSAKTADRTALNSIAATDSNAENYPTILFVEIVSQPAHLAVKADGTPDFSGLLFSVHALNQNKQEYAIVTEATLETVRQHLSVEMSTEPMDPDGLMCTLTFSAKNAQTQQTVSETLKIPFAAAPQSTTTVTTKTTSLSTATTSRTTSNTSVSATQSSQSTSTSSKTTSAGASDAPYLLGDCNADGKCSTADMVLLTKYLVSTENKLPAKEAADLDGNLILNAIDLTWMKRLLLGQLQFPVKNPLVIDSFSPTAATLSDDFSDWHFHIVIKHQYSVPERVWSTDDFKGIDNIKAVTMYDEQEPYRQIAEIALEEPSKENVLKMIQSIERLRLKEIKEIQVIQDAFGG